MDFYNFYLHYIKIDETTYYQRNRETILNRAKDHYKNKKYILRSKQEINIENYQMKENI